VTALVLEIAADDLRAVGQPGPGQDGGRIAERLGPVEHTTPRAWGAPRSRLASSVPLLPPTSTIRPAAGGA
jgi:hypothetical protein